MNLCTFGLSLLLVCVSTTCVDAQIVIGQTHGIHSRVPNENRNYRVYLPDSYAWAKDVEASLDVNRLIVGPLGMAL